MVMERPFPIKYQELNIVLCSYVLQIVKIFVCMISCSKILVDGPQHGFIAEI